MSNYPTYTRGYKNWGENRQPRKIETYETLLLWGGNTIGVLLMFPTLGMSLVISIFTYLIVSGFNDYRYNCKTGY